MPEDSDTESDVSSLAEHIHPEAGDNVVLITVHAASLEARALPAGVDPRSVKLFAIWDFFEHETKTTDLQSSLAPTWNSSCQYPVRIDGFFLQYLRESSLVVDVYAVAPGDVHQQVARAVFPLRSLLRPPCVRGGGERVSLSAPLAHPSDATMSLGRLDVSLAVQYSMEAVVAAAMEKADADVAASISEDASTRNRLANDLSIGKLPQNDTSRSSTPVSADPPPAMLQAGASGAADSVSRASDQESSVVSLRVLLDRLEGLRPRRDGSLPTVYCMYQLPGVGDHDTPIAGPSLRPFMRDLHRVTVDSKATATGPAAATWQWLHLPAAERSVSVHVFDDGAADEFAHIGVAKVPLLVAETQSDQLVAVPLLTLEGQMTGAQLVASAVCVGAGISAATVSTEDRIAVLPDPPVVTRSPQESVPTQPVLPVQETVSRQASSSKSEASASQEASNGQAGVASAKEDVHSISKPDDGARKNRQYHATTFNEAPDLIGSDDEPMSASSTSTLGELERSLEAAGRGNRTLSMARAPVVHVEIFELTLVPGLAVIREQGIKRLFIDFQFLDLPPAELETRSQPVSERERVLVYNFSAGTGACVLLSLLGQVLTLSNVADIQVDAQGAEKQYAALASLLHALETQQQLEPVIVEFFVVSEPEDGDELSDCVEVGQATLSVSDMWNGGQDCERVKLPVIDDQGRSIGHLAVSLSIVSALRWMRQERG
jgi:hypothetical protein